MKSKSISSTTYIFTLDFKGPELLLRGLLGGLELEAARHWVFKVINKAIIIKLYKLDQRSILYNTYFTKISQIIIIINIEQK